MYRTGLGDCFLLAFPKGKTGAFYMLVDCGTFYGTRKEENKPWMRSIVENIRDATNRRIDVLVITHEHWDHVSAFHKQQAQDIFQEIELGALWMAWTENVEGVKLAKDLHEGRKAARAALSKVLERHAASGKEETSNIKLVDKVMKFFGGPLGAKKKSVMTEDAMTWLRTKYGKDKVRFPAPLDPPLELDGVDDARVYILGPPKDRELIKNYYDPWLDGQVFPKAEAMAGAVEAAFFAACGAMPAVDESIESIEGAVAEASRMSVPFDERYRKDRKVVEADAARPDGEINDPEGVVRFARDYYLKGPAWRHIDTDWLEAAGEFALQLDNATNNTSLAFALEIGPRGEGHVLLFPGDAQVGNWLSWFGPVEAKDGGKLGQAMVWKGSGDERDITAEDLLRRTVVYKVGHHGSHNATPTKAMELMGPPHGSPNLIALLPVNEHVARQKAGYGEMPLHSLYEELLRKCNGRLLRNDIGFKPEPDDLASPGNTFKSIPGVPDVDPSFATITPHYFEFDIGPPKPSEKRRSSPR